MYRLKTLAKCLVKLKHQSEGFSGDVSECVSSFNCFVFIMHHLHGEGVHFKRAESAFVVFTRSNTGKLEFRIVQRKLLSTTE